MTTPITVRGRATDNEGSRSRAPRSTSSRPTGPMPRSARRRPTATDRTSSEMPPSRLPGGEDSPSGDVPGLRHRPGPRLRLARHASLSARRRPADWKTAGEAYSIFGGEPMVMDLRFPRPRRSADGSWTRGPAGARREDHARPLRFPRHQGEGNAPQLPGILGHQRRSAALSTDEDRPGRPVPAGRAPQRGWLPGHRRASGPCLDGPLRGDDGSADHRVRLPESIRPPRTAAGCDGGIHRHPPLHATDRRPDGLRRLRAAAPRSGFPRAGGRRGRTATATDAEGKLLLRLPPGSSTSWPTRRTGRGQRPHDVHIRVDEQPPTSRSRSA